MGSENGPERAAQGGRAEVAHVKEWRKVVGMATFLAAKLGQTGIGCDIMPVSAENTFGQQVSRRGGGAEATRTAEKRSARRIIVPTKQAGNGVFLRAESGHSGLGALADRGFGTCRAAMGTRLLGGGRAL